MNYEEFEEAISGRAGMPRGRVRAPIRATLETLADRLTAGEDTPSQLRRRPAPGVSMPRAERRHPRFAEPDG